ncbi:MAG: helix-turn-helix domain-containing protein [Oscillospiraceae bacterium]|nr:helix-turn-helix domain-containing protein [Oscillospiraceae bacterium]
MYEKKFREKLIALIVSAGIAESKLGYELGKSKNYIRNITSGLAMPSIREFFNICEYFEITPADFFSEETDYPLLVNKIIEGTNGMSEQDLILLVSVINRLNLKNQRK